ncbi:MAG: hypothetical protein K6F88_04560 [Ruminococcus sp.]|nr:hypothetical protein [Ruminococcus sp.]
MDMNLYKQTFDSIRISDEAIEKALENLREQDTVGKVEMTKITKHRITKISLFAASLALVIALGAVLIPNVLRRSNRSFTIMANAAELNDKSFTTFAGFKPDGGSCSSESYEQQISVDLQVKGEDIDTIEYHVNNAVFALDSTKDVFVNKYEPVDWFNEWHTYISNLSEKELKERYGEGEYGNERTEFEAYRGYMVTYDNQPQTDNNSEFKIDTVGLCSGIKADESTEIADALKTIVDEEIKRDDIEFKGSMKEYLKKYPYSQEYINAYKTVYSELYDDVTITVTVHYKDGSTGTQTIKLKGDYDINSDTLPVGAIIV